MNEPRTTVVKFDIPENIESLYDAEGNPTNFRSIDKAKEAFADLRKLTVSGLMSFANTLRASEHFRGTEINSLQGILSNLTGMATTRLKVENLGEYKGGSEQTHEVLGFLGQLSKMFSTPNYGTTSSIAKTFTGTGTNVPIPEDYSSNIAAGLAYTSLGDLFNKLSGGSIIDPETPGITRSLDEIAEAIYDAGGGRGNRGGRGGGSSEDDGGKDSFAGGAISALVTKLGGKGGGLAALATILINSITNIAQTVTGPLIRQATDFTQLLSEYFAKSRVLNLFGEIQSTRDVIEQLNLDDLIRQRESEYKGLLTRPGYGDYKGLSNLDPLSAMLSGALNEHYKFASTPAEALKSNVNMPNPVDLLHGSKDTAQKVHDATSVDVIKKDRRQRLTDKDFEPDTAWDRLKLGPRKTEQSVIATRPTFGAVIDQDELEETAVANEAISLAFEELQDSPAVIPIILPSFRSFA